MHQAALQIVEPMHSGHHTNYLLALVPAIERLRRDGLLRSATFTVTRRHHDLLQRAGSIEATSAVVTWDPSLLEVSPRPSLRERFALYESVRDRVDAQRPDALICTSADYDVIPNALSRPRPDRRHWPSRSAAMLHYGLPRGDLRPTETLKRLTYQAAWTASRWHRLLVVNPLVHQSLTRSGSAPEARYVLLADPVPAAPQFGKADARRLLGLPRQGRYIGCVGMMDGRKAIPELLAAFSAAPLGADVRLLLAGRLDAAYRSLIDDHYAAEVRRGRIIVLDRSLSDDELLAGYAAVDLHALLQYRRMNLSANALKCLGAARPFVTDRVGFGAMLATRFNAGKTCDLHDPASVRAALVDGLALSEGFANSLAADHLVAFHSHRNFATTALSSVLGPDVFESLGDPLDGTLAYGHGGAGRPTAPVSAPVPRPVPQTRY